MRCFKLKNDMDSTLIVRIFMLLCEFYNCICYRFDSHPSVPPRDWYKLE